MPLPRIRACVRCSRLAPLPSAHRTTSALAAVSMRRPAGLLGLLGLLGLIGLIGLIGLAGCGGDPVVQPLAPAASTPEDPPGRGAGDGDAGDEGTADRDGGRSAVDDATPLIWRTDDALCDPDLRVEYVAPAGREVADFSLVHDGERFHLFHIRAEAPNWPFSRQGGKVFGHATSTDLISWTQEPDVTGLLHRRYGRDHVWAPHVIAHDGTWHMFYTGVVHPEGHPERNEQRTLHVTSPDLTTWSEPELALDGASPFSTWGQQGAWRNDCRDPSVVAVPGGWAMYVSIRVRSANMAVGVAFSEDLHHWRWVDWIRVTEARHTVFAESPTVWRGPDGAYWLFWTPNDGTTRVARSDDPFAAHWTPVPAIPYGKACEILPLADGTRYFAFLTGRDRIGIERLVSLPASTAPVLSRVVRPQCAEPPRAPI